MIKKYSTSDIKGIYKMSSKDKIFRCAFCGKETKVKSEGLISTAKDGSKHTFICQCKQGKNK